MKKSSRLRGERRILINVLLKSASVHGIEIVGLRGLKNAILAGYYLRDKK